MIHMSLILKARRTGPLQYETRKPNSASAAHDPSQRQELSFLIFGKTPFSPRKLAIELGQQQ